MTAPAILSTAMTIDKPVDPKATGGTVQASPQPPAANEQATDQFLRQRELLDSLVNDWGSLTENQRNQAITIKRSLETQLQQQDPAGDPTDQAQIDIPESPTPRQQDDSFRQNVKAVQRGLQLSGQAMAEGLTELAGLPSDLATLAINAMTRIGQNEAGKVLTMVGQAPKSDERVIPEVDVPLGAEELKKHLPEGFRLPKDLNPAEHILTTGVKWATQGATAASLATKILTFADPAKVRTFETMLAAAGGVTAGLAKEVFGDNAWSEFIGGAAAVFGPQGIARIARKSRELVQGATGIRTDEQLKADIGEELKKLATPEEIDAGVKKSEKLKGEVPDVQLSTAQAVGTPGLIQAERGLQRSNKAIGQKSAQTLAQNKQLIRGYLEKGAPEGALEDTVRALEKTRATETALIDAALIREQAQLDLAKQKVSKGTERVLRNVDERAAQAEQRAQERVNALQFDQGGSAITRGQVGRIIREEHLKELDAFSAEADIKYAAIPNFQFDASALSRRIGTIAAELGIETQGPATVALGKIKQAIGDDGPSQFIQVNKAMKEARRLQRLSRSAGDFKSSFQIGQFEHAIQESFDVLIQAPPKGAEGAIEQLRAADAWYKKGAMRLKAGEAGALRTVGRDQKYRTHDEDIAASFVNGETPVNEFIQALGTRPAAVKAMRDHLSLDFYDVTVNPQTGLVNANAAASWIKKKKEALAQFPELKEQFGDVTNASETAKQLMKEAESAGRSPEKVARMKNPRLFEDLDDATRRQADLIDVGEKKLGEWEKGITSQFLGLDADRAAGAIIRSGKPRTLLSDVSRKIGSDPDGQAGLTRALWDASLDKFGAQLVDAAGSPVLREVKMRKFLDENREWMTERFGADRVKKMETSIEALRALESTGRPTLAGGSDTVQNITSVMTNWGPFLSRVYAEQRGVVSMQWLISERIARIMGRLLKGRSEEQGLELIEQAFYDPKVAQTFVLAAKNASEQLIERRLQNLLVPKIYIATDRSEQEVAP